MSVPYLIGRSTRQVPQVIAGAQRLIAVDVDVVQGKVISVGDIKYTADNSPYCFARVAAGPKGFAMVKGYGDMAGEIKALTKGDIITCDGKYRPAAGMDERFNAVVTTNWFTARTCTLIAPAPVAEPQTISAGEYETPPL